MKMGYGKIKCPFNQEVVEIFAGVCEVCCGEEACQYCKLDEESQKMALEECKQRYPVPENTCINCGMYFDGRICPNCGCCCSCG